MSNPLPLSRHIEATTTDDDPDVELFDWQAFRQNGLLWALNRHVLHPRGLAMASFTPEGDEAPSGWQVLRADDGLWAFDAETDRSGKERFDAFIAHIEARRALAQETPEETTP